ncbi:hypothetical protein D3C71_700010 [compost metagenome]
MVIIRIHLPRIRIWFTALKDWLPPETSMTASVLPCVGRTDPTARGIQSICDFMMPVIAPWRSGLTQTCPSDHWESSRNSFTFGWLAGASSGKGRPFGSNIRTSQPSRSSSRPASNASRRLYETSRSEP